jgi:hypothetical protein
VEEDGRVDGTQTRALRDLISEYGALRTGQAGTAQARGQRFNPLIASMLGWWGIDAGLSVRGAGGRDEIDVVFAVDQTRFILEANPLCQADVRHPPPVNY